MPARYAAFISYAHRHRDWVEALKVNLERCLEANGRPGTVFLDDVDLEAGRSWIGQLEHALERSDAFVLVATPEAFASPWVTKERDTYLAGRPDASDRLQLVWLVDGPLPPMLRADQALDLRDAGSKTYRRRLRQLVAALIGRDIARVALADDLVEPPALPPGVPRKLRAQLVTAMAPLFSKRTDRRLLAPALGFERTALDGFANGDGAASAALVRATGDDDPVAGALRAVDVLLDELGEDEPRRVAPLQPLRAALEGLRRGGGLLGLYRRRVAEDHDQLVPYFQERAAFDTLEHVYVQLALRREAAAERTAGGERFDIEQLLALDPAEHPSVTRRWVLRGDPGAGKTTLLRHLAATLAGRDDDGRGLVPLFASLPRLVREPEWLLDRIERQLGRAGHRGLAAMLERLGQEGRLLLLLDGFDEVPAERRADAEALLRDLARRWAGTPIVVSTRPIGYRRPDRAFLEVELLPFDDRRRRDFLARWFGASRLAASRAAAGAPHGERAPDLERAAAALTVLDADPGLEELSRNPLYLTLMALIFDSGTEPHRHRHQLYDQVFAMLLAGEHRPGGAGGERAMPRPKAVRRALRHLAYELTLAGRDAEPFDDLADRLYQPAAEAVRRGLEAVARWRRNLDRFLHDVANRTGILGPHDGRGADWRFWHRTFREALAGEHLEALWRADAEAVLAHAKTIGAERPGSEPAEDAAQRAARDLSRWAEPYALLAGRVDDPDALVSALVEANRALGLRALATAQGLRDETVVAVLGLTEKWQERAEVYRRIPELLGDAERALALIDRLRRRTRDGNDLYFLHAAVGEARRRWPDHRPRAEHVLARFYDHVPKPDEDLFRSIETPKDGRVTLWAEVPEGSFWMGSPEDEKGRDDDEGPRHQVTIASPFRIGVVPVTVAQYNAFDPDHQPLRFAGVPDEERPFHPVQEVTSYQAVSFCRWLNAAFPWARGARLPVEEEWEHACRAGTETAYWSSDDASDLEKVGWCGEGRGGRTHRVGEKPANPWGLYDVHGNVWEWTASPWTDDYADKKNGVTIDPAEVPEIVPAPPTADGGETPSGDGRVVRGGSFWFTAVWARAAHRFRVVPGGRFVFLGFRVVLPAPRAGDRR